MENLKKTMPYLKNKYVLVCLLFAVLMFGSVYNRISNSRKISQLEKEISIYKKQTEEIQQQLDDLRSDKRLEELARRDYGMKQVNEEVFVKE